MEKDERKICDIPVQELMTSAAHEFLRRTKMKATRAYFRWADTVGQDSHCYKCEMEVENQ